MTTGDPRRLVTRAGQTLTAYAWWSLECAYRDAGMDPARYLTVVQGSHKGAGGGAAASGSTHDAGDTADLRTRDLPSSVRANLCERLVVALRARGWCAWYRDQAHGGFDPHVHAVYRWADPPPSSGARSQVSEYDAGGDGLNGTRPDYHPRPKQTRYPWPNGDDDMPLTDDDAKKVAGAVWRFVGSADPGQTYSILVSANRNAATAANRPAGDGGPAAALTDADVERIAARTADLLAARLRD